MVAETPSKSTRSATAAAVAAAAATVEQQQDEQHEQQDDEEEEEQDSAHSIFRGLQFYLSRDLSPKRRSSVRMLIKEHGGVVLTKTTLNAIELVESSSLRVGEQWVSVDFVYDSTRDGVRRNVADYTAQSTIRASARAMEPESRGDQTPPKRRGRMPFTAQDQVRMNQFLERHYQGKLSRMVDSVPLSVWEIAASQKVTLHSASSMHQHYRKELYRLGTTERHNVALHAEGEEKAQRRKEIARANYLASKQSAPAPAPPPQAVGTAATSSGPPASATESRESRETMRGSPPSAPPPEATGSPALRGGDAFSESTFTSRWQQVLADRSRREELQFFFAPDRHEAPAVGSSASAPASATSASRRRRRSDAASAEQEQKREELEPAPRKKRKARSIAAGATDATATHSVSRQPAAPPNQRLERDDNDDNDDAGTSFESEIDHVVCQLQFETKQASDAVVNALFYASGDVAVATAFLRGASPSGFWSLEDDVLLEDLVSDATDARAVAAARRRGAFATMRVPRTTAQILTRIRFLL